MYILQIYNGLQFLHQNHIEMTSSWRHFTRFTAVSCGALPLPRQVISSLVLVESFQILNLYSGNRLRLPLALLLLAAVERVVVLFENWNYYPLLVCVLLLDQNHIQNWILEIKTSGKIILKKFTSSAVLIQNFLIRYRLTNHCSAFFYQSCWTQCKLLLNSDRKKWLLDQKWTWQCGWPSNGHV